MTDPNSPPLRRRTLVTGFLSLTLAGHARAADTADNRPSPTDPLPGDWHAAETIPLWPNRAPGGSFTRVATPRTWPEAFARNIEQPILRVFRPKMSNRRALLVIPGGGYMLVSVRNEGLDVARRMTADGYTVFVLLYRLPGEGWSPRADVPLQDAQRAVRLIRAQADRHGFDSHKVAALGFSAGGHLAATLATGYAENVYAARDAVDRLDARPSAVGLIYPVVSLEALHAHKGSAYLLVGPEADQIALRRRSPDRHVSGSTPPIFLAHELNDPVVPVQNSLLMLEAMRAAGRPVEAHIFSGNTHGFGLGESASRSSAWPTLFTAWLETEMAGAAPRR